MLAVVMSKVERHSKALHLQALAAMSRGAETTVRPLWADGAVRSGGGESNHSRASTRASSRDSMELEPSQEQQVRESRERRPSSGSSVGLVGVGSSSGGISSQARSEHRRHTNNQSSMWDECKRLRRLKHPNIMSVQDVVEAQLSRPLTGPRSLNLRRAILGGGGRIPLPRSQVLFWQIASGVAYCHEQRIAHRNLKPESIILSDDDQVKLANFSLAKQINSPCGDMCGTMPFVAPEILAGRRYDTAAADVWSIGVVLLEMLCGINKLPNLLNWGSLVRPSPERGQELEALLQRPAALLDSIERDLGILDQGLRDHITGLLTLSPEDRMTSAGARDSAWSSAGAARSPVLPQAGGAGGL